MGLRALLEGAITPRNRGSRLKLGFRLQILRMRMRQRRMGRIDTMCPDMEVWKCMTCRETAVQRGGQGWTRCERSLGV